MEACGSSHHWGRWLGLRGIEVKLLPAKYVRAYVKRNKTDSADATALLEAARSFEIKPVRVKSLEQQALQGLHRLRSGWMATRTARINRLRGLCREFGLTVPVGARTGLEHIACRLADPSAPLPGLLREPMKRLLEEIRAGHRPYRKLCDVSRRRRQQRVRRLWFLKPPPYQRCKLAECCTERAIKENPTKRRVARAVPGCFLVPDHPNNCENQGCTSADCSANDAEPRKVPARWFGKPR